MKKLVAIAVAALGVALGQSAWAGDVAVFGETPFGANRAGLLNVYNSNPGDTATNIGSIDAASLAGIELLWLLQPSLPYTAGQISTLNGFLGGGSRIAFLGEHGSIAPTQNNNISAAIAALGGNIVINNIVLDGGFRVANRTGVGSGGTILTHSLTTGVDQYQYAAFAPLILSGPAQALMLGDDGVSVMMGFENIGPGSIFLITDQNPLDAGIVTSFDNTRMFRNLLSAVTGAPPVVPGAVPEPGTLALLGAALAGSLLFRRRNTR